MAVTRISSPTVLVNNVQILIKSNSYSHNDGKGERTMTAASAGNGVTERVFAINDETRVSEVKFEFESTSTNTDLTELFRDRDADNVIQTLANDGSGKTWNFTGMAVTNNPDYQLSYDGMITLEWKGDPVV